MIELAYIAPEMAEEFQDAVRFGAEAGARSLALRSRIWGKDLEELSAADIGRMKDILSAYGARVSAVYSGIGKCDIEDEGVVRSNVASWPSIAELAHAFDTALVRVFPFQRPGVVEYEPSRLGQDLGLIVERCTPLVRQAESEGLVLCFEAVGSTLARTARELKQVVEALGKSPAVGIIWEIDVAWRAGESPTEGYQFARGITRDVHVKPNAELPLAGDGDTYQTAFRSLLADRYDGPATVEHWRGTENTVAALRELKGLLQQLQ